MRPEAQLWNYLRNRCLPTDRFHASRIEAETAQGFPDVHYTYRGCSGTLELKVSKSPNSKTPFKNSRLRRSQEQWIEQEINADGTVWIVLGCGQKVYLLDGLYWAFLKTLTITGLERISTFHWTRGKTSSKEIRAILHKILF